MSKTSTPTVPTTDTLPPRELIPPDCPQWCDREQHQLNVNDGNDVNDIRQHQAA